MPSDSNTNIVFCFLSLTRVDLRKNERIPLSLWSFTLQGNNPALPKHLSVRTIISKVPLLVWTRNSTLSFPLHVNIWWACKYCKRLVLAGVSDLSQQQLTYKSVNCSSKSCKVLVIINTKTAPP